MNDQTIKALNDDHGERRLMHRITIDGTPLEPARSLKPVAGAAHVAPSITRSGQRRRNLLNEAAVLKPATQQLVEGLL